MHLMYHVLSVSLLDTTVNHAKTAEPIEVLFGIWTRMGPRNHVLQGGGRISQEKGQFWRVLRIGPCDATIRQTSSTTC